MRIIPLNNEGIHMEVITMKRNRLWGHLHASAPNYPPTQYQGKEISLMGHSWCSPRRWPSLPSFPFGEWAGTGMICLRPATERASEAHVCLASWWARPGARHRLATANSSLPLESVAELGCWSPLPDFESCAWPPYYSAPRWIKIFFFLPFCLGHLNSLNGLEHWFSVWSLDQQHGHHGEAG